MVITHHGGGDYGGVDADHSATARRRWRGIIKANQIKSVADIHCGLRQAGRRAHRYGSTTGRLHDRPPRRALSFAAFLSELDITDGGGRRS